MKAMIIRTGAVALLLSGMTPLQAAQLQKVVREYDVLGRLAVERHPDGRVVQFEHDANGNLTKKTDTVPDANGGTTTRSAVYSYDEFNRLWTVVDPLNGTTEYQYDENDNVISVKAPGAITTTYVYNGFGEITRQSSPDTGVTTYDWNTVPGLLSAQTDARNIVITTTWDAAGRPLSRQEGAEKLIYEWDRPETGIDRLFKVTRSAGSAYSFSETYAYEVLGRVSKVTQTIVSTPYAINDTRITEYKYDSAGRLYRLHYPSARYTNMSYTQYAYGADGQLSIMYYNGQPILQNLQWRPFGDVHSWEWAYRINGQAAVLHHSRTFDQSGRLDTLVHKSTTGSVFMSKDLDWDIGGRISKIADSNARYTQSYAYDALDRLRHTFYPTSTDEYGWDANSNRTLTRWSTATTSYTYVEGSNRIASSQTGSRVDSWIYDKVGNVVDDGQFVYAYNDGNRLKSATNKSSGAKTQYFYNAHGQRIVKWGGGGITIFVYDLSGKLLGEYVRKDNTSDLSWQEHLWLGDIPVANYRSTQASISPYTAPLRVLADHLNTPRRLLDVSGAEPKPVWGWEGEAFGATQALGTVAYNLRFPGQYYDVETGKHYNYFRDYDPANGRYIESDPIGLDGGLNTYGYAGGAPTAYSDPTGLVRWTGEVYSAAASTPTGVTVAGAAFWFDLKSECVNGRYAYIRVRAFGVGASLGIKYTAGASAVSFEDNMSNIDPSGFQGTFKASGASVGVGLVGGWTLYQLGSNHSDLGGAPGAGIGIDKSVYAVVGKSRLANVDWKKCDCE